MEDLILIGLAQLPKLFGEVQRTDIVQVDVSSQMHVILVTLGTKHVVDVVKHPWTLKVLVEILDLLLEDHR